VSDGNITSASGDEYSILQQETLALNGKIHSELVKYLT